MPRLRLMAVLLALCLTAGCKAQTDSTDPAVQRRIEVLVRSQFNIPQDFNVAIGARKPSAFTGFDTLPVTLSRGTKSHQVDFLISADGKKLVHMDTFDLTKNPAAGIDLTGRAIRGNPDAKVTVISFDDLECPYCARMHSSLFPDTLNHYKGLVRYIYKDFPLIDMHPWAMHASIDANCLAAQSPGIYWTYVDYLHSHGDEINGPDQNPAKSYQALDRIARQEAAIGRLDTAKLDACLAKQDETQVRASLKEAEALGLDGAPALYINGERINGALPEEYVWMAIDRALRAEGEQPPVAPVQQPRAAPAGNAPEGSAPAGNAPAGNAGGPK